MKNTVSTKNLIMVSFTFIVKEKMIMMLYSPAGKTTRGDQNWNVKFYVDNVLIYEQATGGFANKTNATSLLNRRINDRNIKL